MEQNSVISRVMETRDHFKNGASSKSLMSRENLKKFETMKSVFIIFTLFFFLSFPTKLLSQVHLTGKVKISIAEGTFECDLTMSNIPRIQDYIIRLNAGMNVLHFRSKSPNDFVLEYSKSNEKSTDEALAYYFPDNTGKGKFLPQEIQVRYVGKFPVANDTIQNFSREDWRGNIAFNGYSVRTDGVQTAWYPYLYDVKNDIRYDRVTYDIELICEDCSTIYINGSKPVNSTSANFKSQIPYELALFCGKFDFEDNGSIIILNPQFSKDEIQQFSELVSSYEKYYAKKLNTPFDKSPVFVNTTPTSIHNGWLFVSFPTIMGIGWGKYGLGALFGEKQNLFKPFIAHELGHYYFGTLKVFNSVLGDMMSEGFTEYISLKLTEDLLSIEQYDKKLSEMSNLLENYKTKPISQIKSTTDIEDRNTFVYIYAPVIFLAIEKEIGKDNMWKWLKAILETKTTFTDYDFLTSTLKNTLNNSEKFNFIENTYFKNENSTENALEKIKRK